MLGEFELYFTVVSIVVVGGFFFQAEDGIRDLVRSRGLGDVYKRQAQYECADRFSDMAGHHRTLGLKEKK